MKADRSGCALRADVRTETVVGFCWRPCNRL